MGADPRISAHFAGHNWRSVGNRRRSFDFHRLAQFTGPAYGCVFRHSACALLLRPLPGTFLPGLMPPACAGEASLPSCLVPVRRPSRSSSTLPLSCLRLIGRLDFGSITWLGKPELSLPWRFVRPVKQSCHGCGDSRNGIDMIYPQPIANSVHKGAVRNFRIQMGSFSRGMRKILIQRTPSASGESLSRSRVAFTRWCNTRANSC
jgi:hypothetical protein